MGGGGSHSLALFDIQVLWTIIVEEHLMFFLLRESKRTDMPHNLQHHVAATKPGATLNMYKTHPTRAISPP